MTGDVTSALRAVALGSVVLALLDPGCARLTRPRVEVAFAGDVAATARAATLEDARGAMHWAEVREIDSFSPADARILAGDAAPVLAELKRHPADVAVRLADALEVTDVRAPVQVTVGSRVPLSVQVGDGGGERPVRIRVTDVDTGGLEATVEQTPDGSGRLLVPWLAAREGPRRLRVGAETAGAAPVRRAALVDLRVDVRPSAFTTHLLEARPTWVGRFVRLAVAAGREARVTTDVGVAPGVSVRRTPPGGESPEGDASVLVVSGPEALSSRDVARLERLVRDGGRALVLLLDEPPGAGAWRRLWPADPGRVASAGTPQVIDVAGGRWRAREWLAPTMSTGIVPLAYVNGKTPVVSARALGDGRVVLVTALDAWRWRAEPDVTWEVAWQNLLRQLAADVPSPVTVTAWVTNAGAEHVLQVEACIRADVAPGEVPEVEAVLEAGESSRRLTLSAVQSRRFRGAARVRVPGPHRVSVGVRGARGVVAQGEAVVHVGPVTPPVAWRDVTRHQAMRGAAAADVPDRRGAYDALRQRLVTEDGPRWYATRTWWYAAIVLTVLGSEWILRRARRFP